MLRIIYLVNKPEKSIGLPLKICTLYLSLYELIFRRFFSIAGFLLRLGLSDDKHWGFL
jgi:hypothetical protein